MGNLVRIFFILALLVGCAQNMPEILEKRPEQNEKIGMTQLEGDLLLTNGKILNLQEVRQTTLIYFISESCTSCIEETKELVQLFKEKGLPQNILIYSVLIGSTQSDTLDWEQNFQTQWQVGFDENLFLYKKYFQKLVTPSIVIYNGNTSKVTLYQGKKTIDELQQETGTWEFLN